MKWSRNKSLVHDFLKISLRDPWSNFVFIIIWHFKSKTFFLFIYKFTLSIYIILKTRDREEDRNFSINMKLKKTGRRDYLMDTQVLIVFTIFNLNYLHQLIKSEISNTSIFRNSRTK